MTNVLAIITPNMSADRVGNRRVILAPEETIAAIAGHYFSTYLPTSPEQAAAGTRNAVNTHTVRLLIPATHNN